ncbi:unnamed protein product [Phytophthora lilii]|uniref:Unnamed protein product n=1 Tax=Phytophthora lilii TaxID=2077276 RepID=A0A9W6U881_9STRA|nr:unnamed protein product [Phytophthora lilii]
MAAALNPTCTEEEAVVKAVSELCSKILSREPSQRPKLKTITKQVRKLINDVYDLPVTASDESFIISLYQLNGEGSTPDDTSAPPAFRPFINSSSCCHRAQEHGVTTPARLFWNFFLAGHVTQAQDSRAVASCVGNGHGPASKDILAMDDFESRHEGVFAHFVYLAWHESTSPPGEPNAHECFIEELHEEDHRTCFLLNPHLKSSVETQLTPDVHLFQQLVQHAPQYFPVLQRRLREEAGYVVFIVLGKDAEDTKELQGVLTGMLLFFLRSAFAMTPFDILSYFARTCAQFFDYPRVGFMQHFLSYTAPVIEDSATSNIVQCRCGASVLTLEPSAMNEALSSQHCTCKRSSDDETDASSPIECPCFHPFPANDEPADFDDEVYPIDTMFVHDSSEEQLVHPFECRSKRGDEVRWISVDAVCVGRMESAAFRWSPPAPRLSRGTSSGSNRSITAETGGTGTATSAGSERRMSRFGVLKQRASKVAGETNSPRLAGKDASRAAVEPHELQEMLVRGLQRCGKPGDASSSASWELYECEFCRLPICAVADGRVAVPMLHPRSSDSQRSF